MSLKLKGVLLVPKNRGDVFLSDHSSLTPLLRQTSMELVLDIIVAGVVKCQMSNHKTEASSIFLHQILHFWLMLYSGPGNKAQFLWGCRGSAATGDQSLGTS